MINGKIDNQDLVLLDIKESCRRYFPSHGGLTDFFIWRDDFNERKEVNDTFRFIYMS